MNIELVEKARAARTGWKFLVIGDVMLDVYVHGDATRMSTEEPFPIFDADRAVMQPGGAANTAVNLAQLSNSVVLLGRGEELGNANFVTGGGLADRCLKDALDRNGVRGYLAPTKNYTTELKIRYFARQRPSYQFRCDWRTEADNESFADLVAMTLKEEPFDAIVVSDYAKGSISKRVSSEVLVHAFEHDIPVYVDCRPTNIPLWFYEDGNARHILKLNAHEFEAAGGRIDNGVPFINASARSRKVVFGELLLTRGEHGMFVWSSDMLQGVDVRGRPSPAFQSSVGAGDMALAAYAWARTIGLGSENAADVANVAASEIVKNREQRSISKAELIRVMSNIADGQHENDV